jgi:hypothetical protein
MAAEIQEENYQMSEERTRAIATVEKLKHQVADVQSEQRRFAEDHLALQRRLEELSKPPTQTLDCALYEDRLTGHEKRIGTHDEVLMESAKELYDLREELRCAEADRDGERKQREILLQDQLELVKAAQRNAGPGAGPIHQYKDFRTVRGFRFKSQGERHKIEIAHHKGQFKLALDGEIVGTLIHKTFGTIFRKEQKRMDCKVVSPDGKNLDCVMRMEWKQRCWSYALTVNFVKIPHCWERLSASGSGHYLMDAGWEPPEVLGPPSASPPTSH